jgi:hypothetical protein
MIFTALVVLVVLAVATPAIRNPDLEKKQRRLWLIDAMVLSYTSVVSSQRKHTPGGLLLIWHADLLSLAISAARHTADRQTSTRNAHSVMRDAPHILNCLLYASDLLQKEKHFG